MSNPTLPESQASKAKDKYRVTNWPEYDRALVRRGDITVWFEEDFLRQHWRGQNTGKRGSAVDLFGYGNSGFADAQSGV